MKISLFDQSVSKVNQLDPYSKIEYCGRVAYQSDPRGEPEKFIRKIIERGHESVLEHFWCEVQTFGFMPGLGNKYTLPTAVGVAGNIRAWRDSIKQGYINRATWSITQEYPVFFEDLADYFKAYSGNPLPVTEWDDYTTLDCITNRGVSHELVRHRDLFSYTQESTRYCRYYGVLRVIRPSWIDVYLGEHDESTLKSLTGADYVWVKNMLVSATAYEELLNAGQIPQQARDVLPNALRTQIVVTAPNKQWQGFLDLRDCPKAHPQMQELVVKMKEAGLLCKA